MLQMHNIILHASYMYVPYSGKLSREEMFTSFAVLEPPVKFSSPNLGVPFPPMLGFAFHESFLHETFTRSAAVFSLESFLLYSM